MEFTQLTGRTRILKCVCNPSSLINQLNQNSNIDRISTLSDKIKLVDPALAQLIRNQPSNPKTGELKKALGEFILSDDDNSLEQRASAMSTLKSLL